MISARTAGRRIWIDGSMANGGGGFTYLVNVVPHLCRRAPEDRFRLAVRSERLARSLPDLPNLEVDLLDPASWAERFRFTYLEAPRRARRWGADIYFSAGEYAPVTSHFPVIASFRNPNVFTNLDQGWPAKQRARLAMLNGVARLAARTCERVMFVSEDSASWIGDSLNLPESRRAVVHHGIDASRWACAPAAAEDGSPRGSYILSVSSVYRYKNYVRLIEAYGALARRRPDAPDLVIIGDDQDPDHSRRMQEARSATGELAERIHILGEVPYADILEYYANADLFVFPSYLETFGHPLLEAMASGVPVVAADIPVFREIGGNAAFYADPHKTDALAAAMDEALHVPAARQALRGRGFERIRQFTWERTADQLRALLDEVIDERAARRARATRRPARLGPAWLRGEGYLLGAKHTANRAYPV
jgi:glycosyltransferase involved in cell wall biosynthesis